MHSTFERRSPIKLSKASLQKMLTWNVIWWVSQNVEWFFDTPVHKIITCRAVNFFNSIEKTTNDQEDLFNDNSTVWLEPVGNFS